MKGKNRPFVYICIETCIWDVVALCWMWTCLVNGKIEKYYVYLYICINLYIHVCICVCIDKSIYIYFPKKCVCVIEKQPLLSKIIRLWKVLDYSVRGRRWQPRVSPSSECTKFKMEEILWIRVLFVVIITEFLLGLLSLADATFFIFTAFWVSLQHLNTSLSFSSFTMSFLARSICLKCLSLTPQLFLLKIFISEISQKIEVLVIFSIVISRLGRSSLSQKQTKINTQTKLITWFWDILLNLKKEFYFMIDISVRFISLFIVINLSFKNLFYFDLIADVPFSF